MNNQIKEWKEDGKHLPNILKDFHDQKDLFALLYEKLDMSEHPAIKDINSIQGQCYVIDAFLWFMANYGYTLQKNRTQIDFKDLEQEIKEMKERKKDLFLSIINKDLNK